jgi:hypothetical protein
MSFILRFGVAVALATAAAWALPPGESKKEVRCLDVHKNDQLDEAQLAAWVKASQPIVRRTNVNGRCPSEERVKTKTNKAVDDRGEFSPRGTRRTIRS